MTGQKTLRIFISSPADVRPERLKAEQIIARLNREFTYHFRIEAVLWEREPLVAAQHFQDPENIPQPRGMDIVVVILWSRMGVALPEDRFRGAISGRPVTGTEWEFEDALTGARERGLPDLLLYRKMAELVTGLGDRDAVQARLAQLDLVENFITRWFRSADAQSFTAAMHTFGTSTEFEEQLYDHLHALLERRAGAPAPDVAIRWHEAPFRGLLPFEYQHAAVFFGRTRARNDVRELLARRVAAQRALVLVLGASGSGKSSLVKAGLLPDLRLPGMIGRVGLVRWASFRPSDGRGDPLEGLAAAVLSSGALPELASLQYTQEQLGALLRDAPGQAALPIRQGLAAAGVAAGLTETAEARLVLTIDQFEELFTIEGLGQEVRERFVTALAALAQCGYVWVIATMRSDFYDRLETLPALAALTEGGRYLLLPPHEAELGQIIRQPAQEAGLRFEADPARGVGLDDIIDEAAQKGGLPLLSFLLDQLWQRRSPAGVLTLAAYHELGGLEGAISLRAEEVFAAQPEAVRAELTGVLRALVTVEGGIPTSRPAPLSDFPAGSQRRTLVDALLDPAARLLVADDDAGAAQLRLAHEALLSHWPRARAQVAADMRDLELRGRLEQAADGWRAAPRAEKGGRVIAGLMLAEARALTTRWGGALPQKVTEFIAASVRAARWHLARQLATVAGAVIALPLIGALLWAGVVFAGVRAVESEIVFVRVPADCFDMGSPDKEEGRYPDEGPVRRVCVKAFDLGKFEVTQAQWRRVMVHNPSPSQQKGDTLPVDSISWNEAKDFAALMTSFGRYQYRLPSEAEWEFAARANTKTSRFWGNQPGEGCAYANGADLTLQRHAPRKQELTADCDDGYFTTAPVGSFKPNDFKLHDMLGNVAEFVEDCYVDNYRDAPKDGSAYVTPDCPKRVDRGGSWNDKPANVRAADRGDSAPGNRLARFGVRLARGAGP